MNIGKKLKKLRIEKDLNQKDIADKLGVKRETYTSYELNRIEPPISKLMKLAKIFGVPVEYFLYDDPPAIEEIKDVKVKKIYEEILELNSLDRDRMLYIIKTYRKFKNEKTADEKNKIIEEISKQLNYNREEINKLKEIMILLMTLSPEKRKALIELIR